MEFDYIPAFAAPWPPDSRTGRAADGPMARSDRGRATRAGRARRGASRPGRRRLHARRRARSGAQSRTGASSGRPRAWRTRRRPRAAPVPPDHAACRPRNPATLRRRYPVWGGNQPACSLPAGGARAKPRPCRPAPTHDRRASVRFMHAEHDGSDLARPTWASRPAREQSAGRSPREGKDRAWSPTRRPARPMPEVDMFRLVLARSPRAADDEATDSRPDEDGRHDEATSSDLGTRGVDARCGVRWLARGAAIVVGGSGDRDGFSPEHGRVRDAVSFQRGAVADGSLKRDRIRRDAFDVRRARRFAPLRPRDRLQQLHVRRSHVRGPSERRPRDPGAGAQHHDAQRADEPGAPG